MASPRPQKSTRVRRGRNVATPLMSILALLTLVVSTLTLTPASAAPNGEIRVEVTEIETGSGPGGQLVVGDTAIVRGTWDASDADPQPGDEFTIGLPPEFAFEQAVPFRLTSLDEDGNTVVWAECMTQPATGVANCELTDVVADFPEDVRGVWEFEITVEEATTEDSVVFDLNGTDTPVTLPGGGGIDPGVELPGEVSKSGAMNQNNWSMTWKVDIPGANLVHAGGDARITDTFGSNHVLCDPTGFKVETVRADGTVVADVTDLVASAPTAGADGFDIDLSEPAAGFDKNLIYRITYVTCTIDGEIDPEGTTYDNSMQIQGWGQSGHGVGQVTNRPWSLNLSKSGTVLGGGERNGKIRWTIVVPGDELVNQDSFTFTESFGAGHELAPDTISNIRIIERYGPSSERDTDITGLLTPNVTSQSSTGFDMTFTIDDDDFDFKASDWRYLITYETSVTETELPAGGTQYTNEASIDGNVTGGSSTVPGRKSDKTGSINTTPVTIDGVQHSPQTTLNWAITIPGRQLEALNLAGALNLVDTLSPTHQVCEAGEPSGGLASRLNLKVAARDQLQNGGLTTQDLTGQTTVTRDDQEVTFTLDQTDLPLPGGGTSDGFSREYQYVFTYTTCTTSGGMDAPGTQYGNEVQGLGSSFRPTVTQSNRGSGTGQGTSRGSVAVSKDLADTAGAAYVPDGTTFTVHVKEIAPDGATAVEYDLAVPLDGDPVSGLNSRGRGWTFELSEPTMPNVPGVAWGSPEFTAGDGVTVNADGTVATATITPRSNISVSLTNTAHLGSVELAKAVDGGAAGQVSADRVYLVTAEIDTSALGAGFPAQADREVELVAGEPVVLQNLPIGSTVKFSEVVPADDDTFTWAAPVISPASLSVRAGHVTTPAAVTVTNSVERTVGTFSLVKNVTGAQADNGEVPATVTVKAEWDEEGTSGSKTLTVPTDGTAVALGEDLLIGTEVTLTETPLMDGSSITWGNPVWSGPGVSPDGESAVVTIGRDANATITLENHAATSIAGISLIKGIAGEAADEVPTGTEFPVTATWTDADGVEQSRDLLINAQAPTSLGLDLPAGTVVTITEGERPGFPTVVWDSITIGGDGVTDTGDGGAEIIVSDQQGDVTLVTVTNEATWAPGTFSVSKAFDGVSAEHADVPDSFTVTATWTKDGEPHSKDLVLPADGEAVPLGENLPHGTAVTLKEVAPADTASFTWKTPRWAGDQVTVNGDGTALVTIGAAATAAVEVTNVADDKLGLLRLSKELTGAGADDVPAGTEFAVTLNWTDLLGEPQERDITVKAGRNTTVRDLPIGAEIEMVEDGRDVGDLAWTGATWASDDDGVEILDDGAGGAVVTVAGDHGASVAITLENGFDAADLSGAGEKDDSALADTGSSVSPGWLALGLLSALAGAAIVVAARRRRGTTKV
ncbi:DUF5979 domain-containing protein [Aeromicrobium sp.]|uniref:DUF5979 domain-containing protein n=1 Tax=Aeromicrobium sp. TaxID=1871063 RepID=UPI0028AC1B06|nr:DUF5979 domain-containing protein [Aeromicrobium sp.]